MAWKRGDTESFNAVMTAGDKARAAYEKYLAGQAYEEGRKVTGPEDYATQEARRDVAADVAGPQPGQEFDSYDYQRGGLGATAPAQQEFTDAANRASQASTAGTKYYVGQGDYRQAYDQAPTRSQIHRGGLGGMGSRLASMGDYKAAGDIDERINAGDDRDYQQSLRPQQEEVLKLALRRGQRDENREILGDEVRASAVNLTKRYADAQIALQGGDYRLFKALIDGDYNGGKPGLDDGKKIRFDGDDGISITNAQGFGSTRPLTPKVAEQMLEYGLAKQLSALSPEHFKDYRDFKLKREDNESTVAYRARMVANAEQATANTAVHQEQTFKLAQQAKTEAGQAALRAHTQALKQYEESKKSNNPGHPTYDAAKQKVDKETAWEKSNEALSAMENAGVHPEKVMHAVNQVARLHNEKLLPVKVRRQDGSEETTYVSAATVRGDAYTKRFASEETTKLSEKYGPKAGVTVVVFPSGQGKLGYTAAGSEAVYKSEAEMAAALKLQPAVGLAPRSGAAPQPTAVPVDRVSGSIGERNRAGLAARDAQDVSARKASLDRTIADMEREIARLPLSGSGGQAREFQLQELKKMRAGMP